MSKNLSTKLRTVVLVKSDDLSQVAVFEFETIRYDPELYDFVWNKGGNRDGYEKGFEKKIAKQKIYMAALLFSIYIDRICS